jgi:hypothetical protein
MPKRIVFPAVMLAAGCGEPAKPATLEKAFTIESKQEKLAEELDAREAEQRRQAAAERHKEQAEIAAAVDAAAQLPAEMPADLEAACDAVVEAYDAYMKSGAEKDALEWSDGRRRKLGERRAACVTVGQPKVAACEAQALRAAPSELDGLARRAAAYQLMARCHDKYGET